MTLYRNFLVLVQSAVTVVIFGDLNGSFYLLAEKCVFCIQVECNLILDIGDILTKVRNAEACCTVHACVSETMCNVVIIVFRRVKWKKLTSL